MARVDASEGPWLAQNWDWYVDAPERCVLWMGTTGTAAGGVGDGVAAATRNVSLIHPFVATIGEPAAETTSRRPFPLSST